MTPLEIKRMNELNNIIKYNHTQLFIKYFKNLQLTATCFDTPEVSQHVGRKLCINCVYFLMYGNLVI